MRPSIETYDVELYYGEPMWGYFTQGWGSGEKYKWLWTKEELDEIPEEERGVIPIHKIFAVTAVSQSRVWALVSSLIEIF